MNVSGYVVFTKPPLYKAVVVKSTNVPLTSLPYTYSATHESPNDVIAALIETLVDVWPTVFVCSPKSMLLGKWNS